MKIMESIRLVIMYSDRLALKCGRHFYISARHTMCSQEINHTTDVTLDNNS